MDVIELTQTLIRQRSVSRDGNVAISTWLRQWLETRGFAVEWTEYEYGGRKVNLMARIGPGRGGLAFCAHSDTVPGLEGSWSPFEPVIEDGKLFGRGSADMKGPLAAALVAATQIDPSHLRQPLSFIITADEELGLVGAKHFVTASAMLAEVQPTYGVVIEPTEMIPVYAHKGFAGMKITAIGSAAHTSTDLGVSANFLIAPFLAEMAELAQRVKQDAAYMNDEFQPPTNGMNLTIDDGACPANMTAPRTVATLNFRAMPNAGAETLMAYVQSRAEAHGLEFKSRYSPAVYVDKTAPIVQVACELTGIDAPQTVPYGTDGTHLQHHIDQLIVLGPGDIGVAHTAGEFVPVAELHQAVEVYRQLVERFCT